MLSVNARSFILGPFGLSPFDVFKMIPRLGEKLAFLALCTFLYTHLSFRSSFYRLLRLSATASVLHAYGSSLYPVAKSLPVFCAYSSRPAVPLTPV